MVTTGGTAGAVTISAALHEWAAAEYRGAGRRIVDVPILVDVDEQTPLDYPTGEPLVVFAGSPVYRKTIRFIFAAMQEVWLTHPECRLAVTGAASATRGPTGCGRRCVAPASATASTSSAI